MTASCMDQSMKKNGVVRSAHPPEFSEPWRRRWRLEGLSLAQAISGSNPLVLSNVMSQDSPRTDVRLGATCHACGHAPTRRGRAGRGAALRGVRVDRGDRRPVDDLPGEQSSVLELAKTRSPGTAKRSTLDPADAERSLLVPMKVPRSSSGCEPPWQARKLWRTPALRCRSIDWPPSSACDRWRRCMTGQCGL
jgi:hypothetical protein